VRGARVVYRTACVLWNRAAESIANWRTRGLAAVPRIGWASWYLE
jgi:hypothetical protein